MTMWPHGRHECMSDCAILLGSRVIVSQTSRGFDGDLAAPASSLPSQCDKDMYMMETSLRHSNWRWPTVTNRPIGQSMFRMMHWRIYLTGRTWCVEGDPAPDPRLLKNAWYSHDGRHYNALLSRCLSIYSWSSACVWFETGSVFDMSAAKGHSTQTTASKLLKTRHISGECMLHRMT